MKKVLFAVASLVFGFGTFAQTIVSTEVQKRNVVIEEYTGIGCGYCPLGHQNDQDYAKANPGRVVAINIHQGGYAQGYKPNFTTKYGDALAGQASISGYPAGTLNRMGATASSLISNIGPSGTSWVSSANQLLQQNSPVNVAAEATIDAATMKMTVHVEIYYTEDIEIKENLLNVAILQNNVEGDQHNYGMYNSEQILYAYDNYSSTWNTRYLHMHMLRDFITGQWGDTVAVANEDGIIPAGTFVHKHYTYQIPEYYKDAMYNSNTNVPVTIGEIELAVYIAEGAPSYNSKVKSPNIYTGVKIEPDYINVKSIGGMEAENAAITKPTFEQEYGCKDLAKVSVTLRNTSGPTLKTVKFEYSNEEANDTKTYTWTGELNSFKSTDITFAEPITVTTGATSTVKVKIVELNGEAVATAIESSNDFTKPSIKEGKGAPTLILRTDKKGSEISWKVYNAWGTVIEQGGNYADGSQIKDTVLLWRIGTPGCYTFEISDAGEDGASGGRYVVADAEGNTLAYNTSGSWGASEKKDFKISDIVGLNEANENIFQSVVYPNPAKDMVTLNVNLGVADNANITVVDLMGRTVVNMGTQSLHSGENQIQINTSNLENGLYYIRVTTDNGMTTNKLNVVK